MTRTFDTVHRRRQRSYRAGNAQSSMSCVTRVPAGSSTRPPVITTERNGPDSVPTVTVIEIAGLLGINFDTVGVRIYQDTLGAE